MACGSSNPDDHMQSPEVPSPLALVHLASVTLQIPLLAGRQLFPIPWDFFRVLCCYVCTWYALSFFFFFALNAQRSFLSCVPSCNPYRATTKLMRCMPYSYTPERASCQLGECGLRRPHFPSITMLGHLHNLARYLQFVKRSFCVPCWFRSGLFFFLPSPRAAQSEARSKKKRSSFQTGFDLTPPPESNMFTT